MSMIEKILEDLEFVTECLLEEGCSGFAVKTKEAADTIRTLSEKVASANMERSNGWIPVIERLPEESLNSVIGWDEYRERCCFVQYLGGRWILGDDTESVKIAAWQPLPAPYKGVDKNEKIL